jgi:membrane protein YqaA with SNARE-associated domain
MFEWLESWIVAAVELVERMPVYYAAPMMIVVGAADSSLLSLPEVNDLITVTRVANNPVEVFYFPLFPAVGSVVGCLILYSLVRRGRDFVTRRFHPKQLAWAENLYRRYGFLALAIPALLPPPLPFKIFVVAAGALGYPRDRFMITIMIARTVRYYFWGVAAFFMRRHVLQALDWLKMNLAEILTGVVSGVALFFLIRWVVLRARGRAPKEKAAPSYTD